MASATETKKDGNCGGDGAGRRHGPPTEEERQKFQAEFKQEFLEEFRQRYGDQLISAEQTWELYQAVEEKFHAKKRERRAQHHQGPPHHRGHHSPHHGDHAPPPPHHGGPPPHFEEKRKEILTELQQEFEKDFTTAHGSNKVNADQAWSLIQKVQQNKHQKWDADRQKHGHGRRHGSGERGQHSPPPPPPANQ